MNNFKVVAKNIHTYDQFSPITLDSFIATHGDAFESTIVGAQHYSLQVTIGVNFIANHVMLKDATKDAMRQVARILNNDTLSQLYWIKAAIYEGDRNKALSLCGNLEQTLMGDN